MKCSSDGKLLIISLQRSLPQFVDNLFGRNYACVIKREKPDFWACKNWKLKIENSGSLWWRRNHTTKDTSIDVCYVTSPRRDQNNEINYEKLTKSMNGRSLSGRTFLAIEMVQ